MYSSSQGWVGVAMGGSTGKILDGVVGFFEAVIKFPTRFIFF